MELRAIRGMHDLFGDEMARWTHVENRVKKILHDFGYQEIRTPVVEKKEVFSQTVGDETDIVEKQMYTLVGDDSEKLVLRPEGTAAFMRAVIEHQLHRIPKTGRFYYYLPMFRHERPQKGRLRQFHQFGAELINDATPEADVEIIALLHRIYSDFGINEYEIRINSVGCNDCRPVYKEALKAFLRPKLDQLCEQCRQRFERSPLRILDCKKESCQTLLQGAPRILDHLCENCSTHHATAKKRLTALEIPFIEDANIVRGLDYYSRTAFEFTSSLLGAQSALVGGGRYDGLSTRFGEAAFPAVGFGLGMERLMLALEAKGVTLPAAAGPVYFFAPLGTAAYERLYPLSFRLKQKGVRVEMGYEPKGLKGLLKQADRSGGHYTVMIGDDEIKKGIALIKDMRQGTQSEVPLNNLEETLERKASGAV